MERISIAYITNELRAFRRFIREGELEDAGSCLAHLENIIKQDLDRELDEAYEARELSQKLRKLKAVGALS